MENEKSVVDTEVAMRPSQVSSGTFSIESILKSGAFRCGPQLPTNFSSFPGFQQHSNFSEQIVKREQLEDDSGRIESSMSLPCSSMTSESANCQDDESGETKIFF